MDYKKEFFKALEALGNAKDMVDDAAFYIEELQDEILRRFIQNNPSREDSDRMRKLVKREEINNID